MRITKLHIFMIFLIAIIGGGWAGYVYYTKFYQAKTVEEPVQQQPIASDQQPVTAEQQPVAQEENIETVIADARQSIAVAGEMIKNAQKERKDIQLPQITLRKAKELFASEQYKQAWSLARQAIEEIRQAQDMAEAEPEQEAQESFYIVKRGDNLWNIARMRQHYGLGSKWVKVWRTNENKIPDFDLIYPGQKIIIPEQ